jgi:hypothetical protein
VSCCATSNADSMCTFTKLRFTALILGLRAAVEPGNDCILLSVGTPAGC